MKTFKAAIRQRAAGLILKIIGFEGLVFGLATYAFFKGLMGPEYWLGAAALASGVKTYQALRGVANDAKITYTEGDNHER